MSGNGTEPVALRIKLPYASEDEFVEKYGANVARGGIFIATRAVKPEGTSVAFELVLSDGKRLLRGEGVVVKSQVDESGVRKGMTVRFLKLDGASKAIVDRVVSHRAGAAPTQPPDPPEPAPAEQRAGPPKKAVPPAPSDEPIVLGIDLGTTNCRVAIYRDGAAQLVPLSRDGRTALPSVIYLDEKGRFQVGHRAKAQLLVDPKNTVFGAKRLLGRRMRARRVQELVPRFSYALVADPEGDAGVELRGKVHTLVDLTALLLEELKEAAQNHLGHAVSRAVLCVPAYFSDRQRNALLKAARRADLDVLRIVNEPTAVALAFGYGRGLARKRILVYDLGGGTFDASVVELTGDDLEVVTTGGDNFLGGIDFDHRLAADLSSRLTQTEDDTPQTSLHAQQRLLDAAEQTKIALSDKDSTVVHVPFVIAREDGSPVDLKTNFSRGQLESLTQDLVDRTMEVTRAVLDAGGLRPDGLDEVLLVGGQSRAPLVRERISALLTRTPRTDVDAHAAVALGAAILGHALARAERGKTGVTLSEVLSAPIGIGVRGGAMRRVLERNTRLPAEKSVGFPVRQGDALSIAAFQGEATQAEDNEYLGVLQLTADRAGELMLRFSVSADGTLQLSAVGPGGKTSSVELATRDANDDARAALLAQAPLPGDADAPAGLLNGIKKLFGRP